MPAAAPGNMKRTVGSTIARAIWPVLAPSAMRMPISRLRLVTEKDVTANTPVAATDNAMNAMTTNNAVSKACFDQDNCALASMVLTSNSARSGSARLTASARCGTRASGSPARARTITIRLGYVNCAYAVKKSG